MYIRCSLLGDILFDKKGKGAIRTGERVIRAGKGTAKRSSTKISSLKTF